MKKFSFKLATLLSYREREEQFAQREFAIVQKELENLFAELQKWHEEKTQTEQILQRKQKAGTFVKDLTEYFQYLDLIRKKIAIQQDKIIKAQNIMAKKRQKLIEARKHREILDKLKEKHYAEWQKTGAYHEDRFLDEIALSRYHQNSTVSDYD